MPNRNGCLPRSKRRASHASNQSKQEERVYSGDSSGLPFSVTPNGSLSAQHACLRALFGWTGVFRQSFKSTGNRDPNAQHIFSDLYIGVRTDSCGTRADKPYPISHVTAKWHWRPRTAESLKVTWQYTVGRALLHILHGKMPYETPLAHPYFWRLLNTAYSYDNAYSADFKALRAV